MSEIDHECNQDFPEMTTQQIQNFLETAARPIRTAEQKRPWNPAFLSSLAKSKRGETVQLELLGGQSASGNIGYLLRTN
jgi:hypothetical protein